MGMGGDPPTRALERRIMMFDCAFLTEQEYSFNAVVYFFTSVRNTAPFHRDCGGWWFP